MLQINLAEMAVYDVEKQLPAQGLLSFFFDWKEMPDGSDPNNLDGFRVYYFKDTQQLQPSGLPPAVERLPLCSVHFSSCLTLPDPWSLIIDKVFLEKNADTEMRERYLDFLQDYHHEFWKGGHFHQMLGHSYNVQNDMQREAELVANGFNISEPGTYEEPKAKALEASAADWQLLLQLDTDSSGDMMWGDAGMGYYWIRKADLQALRFEKTWMIWSCH